MKRTKLKKKSKNEIPTLKRKLWKLFSLFIRGRDKYTCFTCGRSGVGSGVHAGHFIPDAVGGVALRYHEQNVHAQCYHCNINLGGWGERYAERMEEVYGREKVQELRALKNQITKWTAEDYKEKIKHYEELSIGRKA